MENPQAVSTLSGVKRCDLLAGTENMVSAAFHSKLTHNFTLLPRGALFVGLDSSTQGLKLVALRYDAPTDQLIVFKEEHVNYDKELPHYLTKGGATHHPDGLTVTAPTLMWVEALDLLFNKLKAAGFPFDRVSAISGSGQQHGSVYWAKDSAARLASLSPSKPLADQLNGSFSVDSSPIWMDSSTTALCRELETALGGAANVASITGSRAYERFTVSQIIKIARTQPTAFAATERISLVSSFLASILIGGYAPIDVGDGSGMNLMDIRSYEWSPAILKFAELSGAASLASKLGSPAHSHLVAGTISHYFVARFNFPATCRVINCSGDNPCSVAGLRLRENEIAVSLGTSDTIFGSLHDPRPDPNEGHIFCNPIDPKGYMALICYKNGSLTREAVRNRYTPSPAGNWDAFNHALGTVPPGNNGNIGFYFVEPEITPPAKQGFYKFDASNKRVEEFCQDSKDTALIAATNVRAVLEGQMLSMLTHANKIGLKVTVILATGGASANKNLIQTMANVFGVDVFTGEVPNSAALGAAFRSVHGYIVDSGSKGFVPFDFALERHSQTFAFQAAAKPDPAIHTLYTHMAARYQELEKQLVQL